MFFSRLIRHFLADFFSFFIFFPWISCAILVDDGSFFNKTPAFLLVTWLHRWFWLKFDITFDPPIHYIDSTFDMAFSHIWYKSFSCEINTHIIFIAFTSNFHLVLSASMSFNGSNSTILGKLKWNDYKWNLSLIKTTFSSKWVYFIIITRATSLKQSGSIQL